MSTFNWCVYLSSHNKETVTKMKREFIRFCYMHSEAAQCNWIPCGILNKVWKHNYPFIFNLCRFMRYSRIILYYDLFFGRRSINHNGNETVKAWYVRSMWIIAVLINSCISFVGVTADDHMMKVETVHCSACSVYIPALHSSVQQHLKSPDHIKGKQVSFNLP